MDTRIRHLALAAMLAACHACAMAQDSGSARLDSAISGKMLEAQKYRDELSYTKSIDSYMEAADMCLERGADSIMGDCFNAIADNYQNINDYNSASEYYNKALTIFVDHKYHDKITEVYRNLGNQCVGFHLYETANSHFGDAFMIDSIRMDLRLLGRDFQCAAKSDYCQYLDLDSLPFLKSGIAKMRAALQLASQYDTSKQAMMECCEQLMMMYISFCEDDGCASSRQRADSARLFYQKADSIRSKMPSPGERITMEIADANFLSLEGKHDDAAQTLQSIEERLKQGEFRFSRHYAFLYRSMIWSLKQSGRYKEAVAYSEKFRDLEESTYNREFAVKSTKAAAEAKYAAQIQRRQKKEQEEIMEQESQTAEQRWVTAFFAACIILSGFLACIIWKGIERKRKNNYLLARQKVEISQKYEQLKSQNQKILTQRAEILSQRGEIEAQRGQLQEANSRITASIRYAQRIQAAAVPSSEIMESIFGECLVYWKPLNIVSGDFFWAFQSGRHKMITAADCTGHGVPGAFMSMLGVSTLNDIAAQKDLSGCPITAAAILDGLRDKIIAALQQQDSQQEAQDGIDMAFCIIDTEAMELQFAGARRPLWIVRDKKIYEYKGDRMPIGYHIKGNMPFNNTVIPLKGGDTVYLASDGISCQPDGSSRRQKFTTKRLKNLLIEIQGKTMDEQRLAIEQAMNKWRAKPDGQLAPLIDDQILLGFRI